MTKLIIGLGNPGSEYERTRHNVGRMFLEYLRKHKHPGSWKLECADVFMNKSGLAVRSFVKKYRVAPKRLIIVHDDLDIEFGSFRLSFARNSAGHRGVQDIIDQLKTNEFWRLRVGTASPKLRGARAAKDKQKAVTDFVLSKFTAAENNGLKTIFKKASDSLHHT